MLRPCQWLEGTDIIKATAPRCREQRGNPGLVAGSDNTAVLILSENTSELFFFWSNSSVHLLISGCYQRGVWSLWFNVRGCKSMLRNRNLLVRSMVTQGLHGSHYARSRSARCSGDVCPLLLRGRRGEEQARTYVLARTTGFSFTAFLQSRFPYKKSTVRIKANIFIVILCFPGREHIGSLLAMCIWKYFSKCSRYLPKIF